jgi:uncharacterized protein (DUF1330 family)
MAYKNSNPLINGCCDGCGSDSGSGNALVIDNSSALIVNGSNTILQLDLKSMFLPVSEYGVQEFLLTAGATYSINAGLVTNANGTLNGLVVLVTYPTADKTKTAISESDKYLDFIVGANKMPLGKIMMLSGTDKDGWFMYGSPAGITIGNPHNNFDVTVKVLYTSMTPSV